MEKRKRRELKKKPIFGETWDVSIKFFGQLYYTTEH